MKILFWILFFLAFWTYFGYPLALVFLLKFKRKRKKVIQKECYPKISIITAVCNEEKNIKKRIQNLLEQDYPKDKLEIIVASDGSTDRTVEFARGYEGRNIKILDFKQNRGRAEVHNSAVKEARGDIIIFTDANTEFELAFLKKVIENFRNSKVGCLAGSLIYKPRSETSVSKMESSYFKFEKKIREMEDSLGILVATTGACMAVRKKLWKNLSPIVDCDFATSLDTISQGYKTVFAKDAVAYDVPSATVKEELKVRIRQTSQGFVGILKRWGVKGLIDHPLVSFSLFSHKVLRWFTPFLLLGLFIGNLFLINYGLFYMVIFWGQLIFYGLAILGFLGEILSKKTIFKNYFISWRYFFNVWGFVFGFGY